MNTDLSHISSDNNQEAQGEHNNLETVIDCIT